MSRTAEEETDRYGEQARSGSRSDTPGGGNGAIEALLREILRGQRRMDERVGAIENRLERGASTLDDVERMREEARGLRDSLVELKTQMRGVLWVAGVAGAAGIGGLITAIFALILKGHP